MMQSTVQTPAAPATAPGTILMNVGGALGAVLLLILVLVRLARRFGLPRLRAEGDQPLKVRASYPLGSRERILVVEIQDSWLVLGVTASHISHLETLAAPEKPAAQPPEADADFTSQIIRRLQRRKTE